MSWKSHTEDYICYDKCISMFGGHIRVSINILIFFNETAPEIYLEMIIIFFTNTFFLKT